MSALTRREGQTIIFPRVLGPEMRITFPDPIIVFEPYEDGTAFIVTAERKLGWLHSSLTSNNAACVSDGFSTTASYVRIARDRLSYTVGESSPRRVATPLLSVMAGNDGEIVVLDPRSTSDLRNVYRFEADGTLRWQIPARSYRSVDEITAARFLDDTRSVISAKYNGWEGTVDDRDGSFIAYLGPLK